MTLSELFLKGSFPYKGKHVEPLKTEKGVCFRHKKLVWRCFDFLSESNIIVTKTCETPDFINFVLIQEVIFRDSKRIYKPQKLSVSGVFFYL